MSDKSAKVTFNGKTVEVPAGTNMVEAAKAAGVEIPVFCHHRKLDPAGVCRMCLVEVEGQRKPITACTTPVSDGMVVNTESELVQALRRGVLEFLLVNHPLDCPVCDKGGECPLQDSTFAYGSCSSRLADGKVRKNKGIILGNFIVLDNERCILCRRCARFDDEIACEGNLIIRERAHNNVVATLDGSAYDSYFSGNTIELCPVGALTSDLYRFESRPWDLARVPAVCTACSVGCSVEQHYRHGTLRRIYSRENPAVDDGWLCDRGRFNYRYVHGAERVMQPLVRRDGELTPVSWTEALTHIGRRLQEILAAAGPAAVGVLGGGRLSLEEAYLLQKLGRAVLGTNNIDHRVGMQTVASVGSFAGKIADLDDAQVILTVDVLVAERSPVLDLRVRRAHERRGARLVSLGSAPPFYRRPAELIATLPGEAAPVLAAAAQAAAAERKHKGEVADSRAAALLAALGNEGKLVVIWSGNDPVTGRALLDLLKALQARGKRAIHLLIPGEQPHSRGAEAMGMLPTHLPGYKRLDDPAARQALEKAWRTKVAQQPGLDTAGMLAAARDGKLKALYVAGANPALSFPDGALVEAALANLDFLVVQDLFLTDTARRADVVLPAAPFPARDGHWANLEGVVQACSQALRPDGGSQPDAVILDAVGAALGANLLKSAQELRWELKILGAEFTAGAVLPGAPELLLTAAAETRPAAAGAETAAAADGDLWLVPVERLYAGGGTARFDEGFRAHQPQPVARLHPADAERLSLYNGHTATVAGPAGSLDLCVELAADVLPGTVQVIRGLAAAPAGRLGDGARPLRVSLSRKAAEVMS